MEFISVLHNQQNPCLIRLPKIANRNKVSTKPCVISVIRLNLA